LPLAAKAAPVLHTSQAAQSLASATQVGGAGVEHGGHVAGDAAVVVVIVVLVVVVVVVVMVVVGVLVVVVVVVVVVLVVAVVEEVVPGCAPTVTDSTRFSFWSAAVKFAMPYSGLFSTTAVTFMVKTVTVLGHMPSPGRQSGALPWLGHALPPFIGNRVIEIVRPLPSSHALVHGLVVYAQSSTRVVVVAVVVVRVVVVRVVAVVVLVV